MQRRRASGRRSTYVEHVYVDVHARTASEAAGGCRSTVSWAVALNITIVEPDFVNLSQALGIKEAEGGRDVPERERPRRGGRIRNGGTAGGGC